MNSIGILWKVAKTRNTLYSISYTFWLELISSHLPFPWLGSQAFIVAFCISSPLTLSVSSGAVRVLSVAVFLLVEGTSVKLLALRWVRSSTVLTYLKKYTKININVCKRITLQSHQDALCYENYIKREKSCLNIVTIFKRHFSATHRLHIDLLNLTFFLCVWIFWQLNDDLWQFENVNLKHCWYMIATFFKLISVTLLNFVL